MIIIKSEDDIAMMRIPAKVTAEILRDLKDYIRPGLSTKDIDDFIDRRITEAGMISGFKGYGDFPGCACISPNEVIVHGIPSKDIILKEGDIVSVDAGAIYKGWNSDMARTYPVGKISEEAEKLITATRESFFAGLEYCRAGNYLTDISHAVQQRAEADGFGVIRDYVGHGVGRELHEDPSVPNYGRPGHGPKLRPGMVLAIEPMISTGSYEVDILDDGWGAVTRDRKYAAHYENTVVITDGDPEVITLLDGE
jgi:methionyl aminopeptidase